MSRFAHQVAIVTGAAGAIGGGVAHRLGAEGATLALLDRDGGPLAAAVRRLHAEGIAAYSWVCDVADDGAVARTVAAVLARLERIDVLVNAAGINGPTALRTHELSRAEFEQVLAVNLYGAFHCIRAVLPPMLDAGYGRIVNLASIAGKAGNPGMLAYSASKAGLIGLTKVVGKEYAGTGIVCNAVAPALVRTPATEASHTPERYRGLVSAIPMRRTGRIEEVAAVTAFAASPECSFTTGFTFDASGGRAVY